MITGGAGERIDRIEKIDVRIVVVNKNHRIDITAWAESMAGIRRDIRALVATTDAHIKLFGQKPLRAEDV